ncbi:copper-binding protein [Hafnia paralvei]|uniref:copper-binding protein n=1 Tax=Hafnia paralvei TaxID=546367 RepID=UPI002430C37F|nr:copper-binding protein [Hafnia paralvei]
MSYIINIRALCVTTAVLSALTLSTPLFANTQHHDMSNMHDSMQHHDTSATVYHSSGTVKSWSQENGVSLTHAPIPALHWPAMTMTFSLPSTSAIKPVAPYSKVNFSFIQTESGYQLTEIHPVQ